MATHAIPVHGAGQQQLRHVFANIGAWHLLLWLFTLIELWAWHRSDSELVDRTASPQKSNAS
ncbi:MAG: hypothetical protein AB7U20_25150 [Planctomycetaceae bacterium]